MVDRVHPDATPPTMHRGRDVEQQPNQEPRIPAPPPPPPMHGGHEASELPNPEHTKPVLPPPATYVIQLPKEQILRYPPPENARKMKALANRSKRRSCRRKWCCTALFLLIAAVAAAAGVFYLVFRPKSPKFSVTHMAIRGMNVTSASPISPAFDVSIRSDNTNKKLGFDYRKGGYVNVEYDGVRLSYDPVFPAFYQPSKNVTVLETALEGSSILLGNSVKTALRSAQNRGSVPLVVTLRLPVKIKVGFIKTWKMTFTVECDVIVDKLNERANIVKEDCDHSVRLW